MSKLNTNKHIVAVLLIVVIACATGSALAFDYEYSTLAWGIGAIGSIMFIILCVWTVLSAKAIK